LIYQQFTMKKLIIFHCVIWLIYAPTPFFLIHFRHTSYISGYFRVCVRFSVATILMNELKPELIWESENIEPNDLWVMGDADRLLYICLSG